MRAETKAVSLALSILSLDLYIKRCMFPVLCLYVQVPDKPWVNTDFKGQQEVDLQAWKQAVAVYTCNLSICEVVCQMFAVILGYVESLSLAWVT